MKYEPKLYRSPIDLPTGQSGKVSLVHRVYPVGHELAVVGMRQGFLRGIRPAVTKLIEPRRVHTLQERDVGVWMTDLPEELNQIGEVLHSFNPTGRVLVGGFGLGIITTILAGDPNVDEVVAIEKSADVLKLCVPNGASPEYYSTVHCDITEFLQGMTADRFDCFLLDTWQGTSENTWWETVMPLRRIIRNRWGRGVRLHCWAEDIMWGQVERSLLGQPHWYYDGIAPLDEYEAREFVRNVGLPDWESKYGDAVDANRRGE